MTDDMQARRVLEAASWRLVSEIVRRHPELRVAEMHFGGGQSDSLVLLPPGHGSGPACDFNRPGSMHVFDRLDGREVPDDEWMWSTIWSDWSHAHPSSGADLKRVVREVESRVGLLPPPQVPPTGSASLTYRVIAAITVAAMFNLDAVDVRNGYLDSDYGGGPREELFTPFRALRSRRETCLPDDPGQHPEYRFWFVIRAGHPVLALEPASGTCWGTDGTSHDLYRLYVESGRRLWPVVTTVALDVIEPRV